CAPARASLAAFGRRRTEGLRPGQRNADDHAGHAARDGVVGHDVPTRHTQDRPPRQRECPTVRFRADLDASELVDEIFLMLRLGVVITAAPLLLLTNPRQASRTTPAQGP